MKSGSREIQKAIEKRVPLTYPKKAWLRDVAKDLGCTYLQAENLYYRPGRQIPNEIYLKLLRTSATPATLHDKQAHLQDLEEREKELDRIIRDRTNEIANAAIRAMAEGILQSLPRTNR